MKKRNFPLRLTSLAFASFMALLAGCALTPVKPSVIAGTRMENQPPPPQAVFGPQDQALACLGDLLAAQKIQPLVFGYSSVTDTTGKIGVDFVAVLRSELGKVVTRVPNLAMTAMGFGPSAKPELPSVEERLLQRDPSRAARLIQPDVLITGGSVSVSNAFLSLQDSIGISGRDASFNGSSTATVDLVSLSFGLKSADSGLDIGRTVDTRVSYQLLSNAKEAGVFAQAKINGRTLGAGLRFGRTVAVSQIAEDAIRIGIADAAVLRLLAARYSVDIDAACPNHVAVPDDKLPKAEQLPTANELPKIYQAMSHGERVSWFQARLTARGYAPGELDGQLGPRTRQALVRIAQDSNLPPVGQITDALFYVLAMRDLTFGRDPRKPLPAAAASATPQRIAVQLNQPNAPYATGVYLRASVVVPQAGYMHCWLMSPDGPLSLYPILPGRGNYATAAQPVPLPDPNISGPHPRLRLTTPGAHELWCGEARSDVNQRLPAELRAGGRGQTYTSVAAIRDAFVKAAGTDLIAEGSAQFNVFDPQAAH